MAALRNLGAWANARQGTILHLCQINGNKAFGGDAGTSLPSLCRKLLVGGGRRRYGTGSLCAAAGGRSRPGVTCSMFGHEARVLFAKRRCCFQWGNAVPLTVTVVGTGVLGKGMSTTTTPGSTGPNPGEFSVKTMKYTFAVLGVLFSGITGFLLVQWGSPPTDEEGNPIEDEFSHLPMVKAYSLRFWRELHYYDKMIKEPSREKLLPEPLTEPYYQPPYTVVLEMTGVLVHPDWTYKTGWRFKKRPGVDYFFQQISPPLYETVIYTSEQGFTAYPILDTLDPQGRIMYRLFRDATRYVKGHHVKDLSCLNRDLSKVIFIDWNENSFQMQPENALKLKKWSGNDDDRTLIDLAAFLRTIATSQVDDVRTVLAFYKQFDDPIDAFKQNQKRLEEEQQKGAASRGVDKSDRRGSWTSGFFKRWQA